MEDCLGDPLGRIEQETTRQMGIAYGRDGMSVAERLAAHHRGLALIRVHDAAATARAISIWPTLRDRG